MRDGDFTGVDVRVSPGRCGPLLATGEEPTE